MIVLGIDPGSNRTGYGVLVEEPNRVRVIDYGSISLGSIKTFPEKLKRISEKIKEIIQRFEPRFVAIEDCFYAKNVKSALKLGHVRGAVILTAVNEDVEVSEYSPLEIKKAVVGYGRAEKMQVQQMMKVLLNLDEIPQPEDSADALACAYCHIATYRFKKKIEDLPKE
ncbi:crossover junction endodeoxyribonuclease RuvC [bacterium]|nr:crossover junction endodeoxyribonuclease RuvC [bacterium]